MNSDVSATATADECVSEGQWVVNVLSEGEVPDLDDNECKQLAVLAKLMSDERQSWPISSADKIGQQKSVVCHARIGRICLPPKSSDFIVQVERVLFSTRKSPNFLECRAVIGQQSVYTTNL